MKLGWLHDQGAKVGASLRGAIVAALGAAMGTPHPLLRGLCEAIAVGCREGVLEIADDGLALCNFVDATRCGNPPEGHGFVANLPTCGPLVILSPTLKSLWTTQTAGVM